MTSHDPSTESQEKCSVADCAEPVVRVYLVQGKAVFRCLSHTLKRGYEVSEPYTPKPTPRPPLPVTRPKPKSPYDLSAAHAPAVCKRVASSAHFHTRSWSHRFECLTCGKSRRYNDNFLGSRYRLVCDGKAIKRVHRDDAPKAGAFVDPPAGYVGPDYPWFQRSARATV